MQARFTKVLAVIALLVSPTMYLFGVGAGTCTSQPETLAHHEAGPAGPYVMTGRIERREERLCVSGSGRRVGSVSDPARIAGPGKLRGQVGQLSVREPILHTEGEPRLWVDRITWRRPVGSTSDSCRHPRSNRPFRGRASRLAQFTEPVGQDSDLAVPGVAMAVGEFTDSVRPTRLDLGRHRFSALAHGRDERAGTGDNQPDAGRRVTQRACLGEPGTAVSVRQ